MSCEPIADAWSGASGRLQLPTLRSLDAIHPATALEIGDDLEDLVAYDARLIEAANAVSIEVVSPSG